MGGADSCAVLPKFNIEKRGFSDGVEDVEICRGIEPLISDQADPCSVLQIEDGEFSSSLKLQGRKGGTLVLSSRNGWNLLLLQ